MGTAVINECMLNVANDNRISWKRKGYFYLLHYFDNIHNHPVIENTLKGRYLIYSMIFLQPLNYTI